MKTKQWFIDRIGEKVYRNSTSCSCVVCEDTVENGIVIGDKFHVEYMWMIQGDYGNINYRDEKENN